MTLIASLMDYSLDVLCGGNKNELSRRLVYRRGDLNRMLEQIKEGAHNIHATEALLRLLRAEQCSLDEILAECAGTQGMIPGEAACLACEDMAHALREQMANQRRAASQKMQILQSAEAFMRLLERTFCSDLCRMRRGCDEGCPCKRFSDFVDWIQAELNADSGSIVNETDCSDAVDSSSEEPNA